MLDRESEHAEKGALEAHVAGVRGHRRKAARDRVALALEAGEAQSIDGHRSGLRAGRERLLVETCRAGDVVEAELGVAREAHEDAPLRRGLARGPEDRPERAVDAVPLSARLVEAEETPERCLPVSLAEHACIDAPERLRCARVGRGRGVGVVEAQLEDRGRTHARPDLHVWIARRVGVALEHLSEPAEVAGTAEEALEGGDDRRVRGGAMQRLEVGGDRVVDAAEVLLEDPRDTDEQLDDVLGPRGEIEQAALRVDDALPAALLLVDPGDRARSRFVPRRAIDHDLVGRERSAEVLHPRLERRADAVDGGDLVGAAQHARLRLEHVDVLAPAPCVGEGAGERDEDVVAVLGPLERLAPEVGRAGRLSDARLQDLGELQAERTRAPWMRRLLERVLVERDEPRPLRRGPVHPVERIEGGRVGRVERERALVEQRRFVREVGRARRLDVLGERCIPHRADLGIDDPVRLASLELDREREPALATHAQECLHRRRERRRRIDREPVSRERVVGTLQPRLLETAEAEERPGLLRRITQAREEPFVRRRRVFPASGGLEHERELLDGRRVTLRERRCPHVAVRRARMIADALGVHVSRALEVLARRHGLGGAVRLGGDDPRVFVPCAPPQEDRLERRLCAGVRRIRLERAAERRQGAVGIGEVPIAERARRAVERAPRDRVVRDLRNEVERLDDAAEDRLVIAREPIGTERPSAALVSGARAEVEGGERVERTDVVRLEHEQLAQRSHRRGDVTSDVLFDRRSLPEQARALAPFADMRELGARALEHVEGVGALLREPSPRARDEPRLGRELGRARERGRGRERVAHRVDADARLGREQHRRAHRVLVGARRDLARDPVEAGPRQGEGGGGAEGWGFTAACGAIDGGVAGVRGGPGGWVGRRRPALGMTDGAARGAVGRAVGCDLGAVGGGAPGRGREGAARGMLLAFAPRERAEDGGGGGGAAEGV